MLFTSNTFDTKFLRLHTLKKCFKSVQKSLLSITKNGHTSPNIHKFKLTLHLLTNIYLLFSLHQYVNNSVIVSISRILPSSPPESLEESPLPSILYVRLAHQVPLPRPMPYGRREGVGWKGGRGGRALHPTSFEKTHRHLSIMLPKFVIEIVKFWVLMFEHK